MNYNIWTMIGLTAAMQNRLFSPLYVLNYVLQVTKSAKVPEVMCARPGVILGNVNCKCHQLC